ncbi:hypothetical protein DE146DRAFT_784642 [Phaeosphaeria sp. MPI-PUGE-AT-0046c]|nr:hypothetical protein DE146DRAFT_784642 [Phaeosphaeria sp. MPI-PUGE-AT-0046c]
MPTKHSSSPDTQPDQVTTPLRRRFLEGVGMVPATPPRTPSPTKERASSTKRSESPRKGKDSPTKQNLEIVPGGFYYSCELPLSKITPKKKEHEAGTPTKRTPSPTKMGDGTKPLGYTSPTKQTPAKRAGPEKQTAPRTPQKVTLTKKNAPAQPGSGSRAAIKSSATKNGIPRKSATPKPHSSTLVREPTTPQPATGRSGKLSPTKSIKLATKLAQGAFTPNSTRSAPQQAGVKQLVASNETTVPAASSSEKCPRPSLNIVNKAQTRPARVGSFDIGESMAALKKHTPQLHNAESDQRAGGNDISGPPTPLRKAAEKLGHIEFVRMSDIKPASSTKELDRQAQSVRSPEEVSEPHIYASPFIIKEQTSHYRLLPFAVEAQPISEAKSASSSLKKQVNFLGPEPTISRLPRPVLPRTMRRAGTNPLVHLTMRQEMSTLTKSLSDSLGIDFNSKGRDNDASPLPEEFTLPASERGTPALKRRTEILRTAFDVTDVSNASGSSVSMAGTSASMRQIHLASPITPNAVKGTGKPLPQGAPTLALKDAPDGVQSPIEHDPLDKELPHASGFTRPPLATSARTATPTKKALTTAQNGTLCAARAVQATSKPKLFATPAKPKPASTFPQSARKSAFDTPALKIASPARPKTQKPLSVSVSKDAPPPQSSHPVFVGARDIAARIADWNKPSPTKSTPSPPKSKTRVKESHTPEGSPSKPNTPVTLAPKTPKRIEFMPRRAAPATPVQNRTPAQNRTVARVRGSALGSRGRADPMATRTPSKGIQESLSKAIDRKIEEDKKNGTVWKV